MLFFLDIDGVMVPAKGWKSPEFLKDGFPAFSSKATHTLQHLITEDDTIMLTTSHKSTFSIEEWKTIFGMRGINISNLKSLPENVDQLSRKDEIINWFHLNHIHEDFVIIDDDQSLNDLPDFLKRCFIQTSPTIGLVQDHAEMIKLIAKKRSKSCN